MSLATSISEIDVYSSSWAIDAAWSEVGRLDLPALNQVFLKSPASLYQYPLWNEPYRKLGLTPRYLVWGTSRRPIAAATILTAGFGPVKIGLVFRGPVQLIPEADLPHSLFAGLLAWARLQGYVFLRFTHSNPQILSGLAAAGHALNEDAFPYMLDYPVLTQDYMAEQQECDEHTLASFDREVRRKLRRAEEAGYEFRAEDSPEALAQAWPLYEECSRRKQFRLERPLSFYVDLMRTARAFDMAQLYTVRLHGKTVGSTLVFRDRTTAHCQIAAFDTEHRQSAVFLHWHAMRHMYRLGARRYNMGPGPGALARFKGQFCQRPVQYPGPITVVLRKNWFRLWRKIFIPAAKQLHPIFRKLAMKRAALSR
ncbi:MAG TPA: GNAT family N-acetyltransferase [Candidatus Sulfotelmatobacter sp.]|jgi:hypothetical protein|nr:GNAT family N-acetyltransferase [Candidatus Sulfotelmatobacter sp.]